MSGEQRSAAHGTDEPIEATMRTFEFSISRSAPTRRRATRSIASMKQVATMRRSASRRGISFWTLPARPRASTMPLPALWRTSGLPARGSSGSSCGRKRRRGPAVRPRDSGDPGLTHSERCANRIALSPCGRGHPQHLQKQGMGEGGWLSVPLTRQNAWQLPQRPLPPGARAQRRARRAAPPLRSSPRKASPPSWPGLTRPFRSGGHTVSPSSS